MEFWTSQTSLSVLPKGSFHALKGFVSEAQKACFIDSKGSFLKFKWLLEEKIIKIQKGEKLWVKGALFQNSFVYLQEIKPHP